MSVKRKKTVVVPDGPIEKRREVMFALVDLRGGDSGDRDPSKPLAVDENGNPLYFAPRGPVFRFPWGDDAA